MKIANYGVPDELASFSVSPITEGYWQELAAYVWVKSLWSMKQAGMQIVEVEESDVATLQGDFSTALTTSLSAIDALFPGGTT